MRQRLFVATHRNFFHFMAFATRSNLQLYFKRCTCVFYNTGSLQVISTGNRGGVERETSGIISFNCFSASVRVYSACGLCVVELSAWVTPRLEGGYDCRKRLS